MGAMSVMIKPASGLCNMRCRYCFGDIKNAPSSEGAFLFRDTFRR